MLAQGRGRWVVSQKRKMIRFVDLRQTLEQPTAHQKETSGSHGKLFVGI